MIEKTIDFSSARAIIPKMPMQSLSKKITIKRITNPLPWTILLERCHTTQDTQIYDDRPLYRPVSEQSFVFFII